jgi:hypothetical protein
MDDGEVGTSIDTAHGLALQLLQSEPPRSCSLTRIYGDKLAYPLSDRLEEFLLRLEKDDVALPDELNRRHDDAALQVPLSL